MTNIIAVVLTLTGPRRWILIKAFFLWIYYSRRRSSRGRRTWPGLPQPHSIIIIEESRNEFEAAIDLIRNILGRLRAINVDLSSDRVLQPLSSSHCLGCFISQHIVCKIRNLSLVQHFDIVISTVLAFAFLGVFVAESSGSVLSAYIVSDTVAFVSPSTCSISPRFLWWNGWRQAFAYSQNCYNSANEPAGCNYFYNQSIAYTEGAIDVCPFEGNVCPARKACIHL